MKATSNSIRVQYTETGKAEIVISTNLNRFQVQPEIEKLKAITGKGKSLDIEIKQHREKRSLDANAYFWVLLSEMAGVLRTTKDELYLLMLERYGVFTHVIVKPEAAEILKKEWRLVRDLGEVLVNGKTGIQLQCYIGSSQYDSKQMSRLIEGAVSEAQELDIDTMTEKERQLMLQEWGCKRCG